MNSLSMLQQSDPYEQLIAQMIALESRPQQTLKDLQKTQERFKTVMKDVDSKMSALHKLVKSFTSAFSSPFDARKADYATNDYFGATASKDAALGSHSIEVQRLAASDKRLSKQYTASGGDLKTWFTPTANQSQTFGIEVAHPTDADPANRVEISVTVTPVGTTNEEILKEIATAINDAMAAAVDAGTIKKEEAANAATVNETTDTARLTLSSGQTGFANRLVFNDSSEKLLETLELNLAAVSTGTGGGMVTDIGTTETDSLLNSKFVLNGLTMYRSSNSVTDALTGITLDLKKTGGGSQSFTVKANKESIKKEIEDFITKYNDILTLIEGKSKIDADAGVRGDLAGDSTFTSLRYQLRNDVALQVSGQPAETPQMITDLGIEIQKDGTLKLTDSDKLVAAVEKDADAVESLFSGADGIATRLQNRIDRFVGVNGIISDRQDSIDTKIKRLKTRISDWDDRLARREDSLRTQFAKMQESIAVLQGQQQSMMMFFG